ncbi:IS607 family transposase [Hassallia byssoidea VB512170]|uniref:IS607 family transposase n=1 Tax=Hassallia byssoidea VB512170 TaxID=1304833 RepID=A0A846H8F0_9CYAN|nr:IS607 family transposase [Hassalia byssoidea]NEU73612.1 IS607 family transposase [Hassalia byssoidea VB512170]
MSDKYVSPADAARTLGVNERTLRRWEKEEKITAIRTVGGQRRYDITAFTTKPVRCTVIYARVSSPKQREDLQRQCDYLESKYPNSEIIAEIGGGLNYKRKKFLALLERVMQGDIERIVIAYKDRLARFGFDFFAWLCSLNSCEIVVLNQVELSPEREMVEDILAILHCFSARLYGLRKYKSEISKDKNLPRAETPSNLEKMARGN